MPLRPMIVFVPGIAIILARILIIEAGEYIGNSAEVFCMAASSNIGQS
jgi:hypothetical protein